jgi:hypothetical protein
MLDLETYETFRKYIQHEDNLANQRMTWMLTIHGFLYAAYALTVQKKLEVAQKINDAVNAGHAQITDFLQAAIWQTDYVIVLITLAGLIISFVAYRSVSAARNAAASVEHVFEQQYPPTKKRDIVAGRTRLSQTVITEKGTILPTIAGGGDPQQIMRGFAAARNVPRFLMFGWILSLCFELFIFLYANQRY